ncbi:MAG: type II secretion system F family protein [Actinobacteria bacterium]|nr:type II secretion system F family protein [Actinomycetota bacterium]
MLWIAAVAALSIMFLALGRNRDSETAAERLNRFHHRGRSRETAAGKKWSGGVWRFFERIFELAPESIKTASINGLEQYSPFLEFPAEVLAGLRISAVVCLPLALLMMTDFSAAGIALSIPGAFLSALMPRVIASRRQCSFFYEIRRALPNTADILYSLVLGGKNLDQAFKGAAELSTGPLKDILSTAISEMELGASKEESFDRLAGRYPVPQLSSLLRSILEAEKRGLELSETLKVYSRELRMRHRDELRVRVAKAPLKILIPLVFLILPSAILLALGPTLLSTFSQLMK